MRSKFATFTREMNPISRCKPLYKGYRPRDPTQTVESPVCLWLFWNDRQSFWPRVHADALLVFPVRNYHTSGRAASVCLGTRCVSQTQLSCDSGSNTGPLGDLGPVLTHPSPQRSRRAQKIPLFVFSAFFEVRQPQIRVPLHPFAVAHNLHC